MDGKKIYFLSDFHLGAPDSASSRERERKIVSFLQKIKFDAAELFLLGDMFDFWFEYKKVVPKGYVRLLGTLAQIADEGVKIRFFAGNHDMWVRDYFTEEMDMKVYHQPEAFTFGNKTFLVGHGDGLGPGDHGYKRLKKIFRNPLAQFLFGILPPRIGIGMANYFSRRSRAMTGGSEEIFLGEEKEWLITYCREELKFRRFDYFVFGHRHLPIDYKLDENSRYINLGDWITHYSYAVFDGANLELRKYQ